MKHLQWDAYKGQDLLNHSWYAVINQISSPVIERRKTQRWTGSPDSKHEGYIWKVPILNAKVVIFITPSHLNLKQDSTTDIVTS